MGSDKALLLRNGRPLVEQVAEIVREAAGSATLVGPCDRYRQLGIDCIPDLRPGLGPLSGLEALLTAARAERNLVLACDMPDVPVAHLTALLSSNASCVITQDASGRLHPLCAVYDQSCLPAIREAIDAGCLKLLDVIAQLSPLLVRYPGALSNINTLEDLRSAG